MNECQRKNGTNFKNNALYNKQTNKQKIINIVKKSNI